MKDASPDVSLAKEGVDIEIKQICENLRDLREIAL